MNLEAKHVEVLKDVAKGGDGAFRITLRGKGFDGNLLEDLCDENLMEQKTNPENLVGFFSFVLTFAGRMVLAANQKTHESNP
jgi:hypothetical protein